MTLSPNFIRIKRDTGAEALVRVDTITAILHNTMMVKEGAEKVERPALSIQLGPTVVIHTFMDEPTLLKLMCSAGGRNVIVSDPERDL